MKKIDRQTVQRILDAADIVEVVSDFVSLKKRGANYIGLCPFHNERTPSFSVSKAKGICKCFSCGKGGSPVNFIMEHEQMSFQEALRYLAKKYNIEIQEHEETEEERQQASEREALIAVNEFALKHFEHILTDTPDGRDIGLAYFRHRGINDQMIRKFRLGYALEKFDDLYSAAHSAGYSDECLLTTGLCAKSDKGKVYDRFRGRVIYPVFSVSGRVVAFGGRTLRNDKVVAKYVNSPESPIYHKSRELYGLFQAKGAINRQDKCILVEGYMDVISMHQAGIENVVASSGTSLTEGQIRLIHRFTQNVTVIYDSDAAGIKASLRGIDLLLAEGLNIKVLLLPEGDDPDSFAQSHSSSEVDQYIAQNETDFISFKTTILLKDAGKDPLRRAEVINDIVRSISVIPDPVARAVYMRECAHRLNIEERVLALRATKLMADRAEKQGFPKSDPISPALPESPGAPQEGATAAWPETSANPRLVRQEKELAKYVVRYAFVPYAEAFDQNNKPVTLTVLDYIKSELSNDDIEISDPSIKRIFSLASEISARQWPDAYNAFISNLNEKVNQKRQAGMEEIRQQARDLADIQTREAALNEEIEAELQSQTEDFCANFLESILVSSADDGVRTLATELAAEKYELSRVHTKYAHVETERERLGVLVERAVWELKFAILEEQIASLNAEMRATTDPAKARDLMQRVFELYQLKSQFAKALGDRIVNPK